MGIPTMSRTVFNDEIIANHESHNGSSARACAGLLGIALAGAIGCGARGPATTHPRWDTEDPFDEGRSTHLWIVNRALDILRRHQDPNSDPGAYPTSLYLPMMEQFRDRWEQALYDADCLSGYNDGGNCAIVIFSDPINAWKSHFYDPDTRANYRGETDRTALVRAHDNFTAAVDNAVAGNWAGATFMLGLALHYMTDVTQPMHAANFTALSFPVHYHSDYESFVLDIHDRYPRADWSGYPTAGQLAAGGYTSGDSGIVHAAALAAKPLSDPLVHKKVDSESSFCFTFSAPFCWQDPNSSYFVGPLTGAALANAQDFTAKYIWLFFNTVWQRLDRPYAQWAAGEPNGGTVENCAHVYASGAWNDAPCSYGRRFACKGPAETDWAVTGRISFFDDGYRACQDDPAVPQGYVFAAPRSPVENVALRTALNLYDSSPNNVAWINLTDRAAEGKWVTTTAPRFWAAQQPDGDRRANCATIANGSWYDEDCQTVRRYACKGGLGASDWQIASRRPGPFRGGPQACKADFGPSYRFSAPQSADENAALAALVGASGSVWINATDETREGQWLPLPNHVMERATAYQSDNYSTTLYQARNAIDGSLSSFTQTTNLQDYPYIDIDLGGIKEIEPNGITIWNRADCCQSRLDQFFLLASRTPLPAGFLPPYNTHADYVYAHPDAVTWGAIVPTPRIQARYIRIQLERADFPGGDRYLSIGDIEVRGMAVCPGGECSTARLISHYTLDDVVPLNQSPLGSELDVRNNAADFATYPGSPGAIRLAHRFDSAAYIDARGQGRYDLDRGTMMAWIYPTWSTGAPGYNPAVMAIRDGGAQTRMSVHVSTDYNVIGVWNGQSVYQFAATGVTANRWTHIAVVFGDGVVKLYVDGTLRGTQAGGAGSTTGLGLNIGWNGPGSTLSEQKEHFIGTIDEVRVFDGALDDSEIAAFAQR